MADGTEEYQVQVGTKQDFSHYETYTETKYVTIGTKAISVEHNQCWTADNSSTF